ncbi:MAG: 30S ribosomal protein S2 [Parachlamydiales bacterium]|jgi:small subunit ribosomal protein S2
MTAKQQIDVTIKDLLQAGAHFGHQKRRWNPKMKRFIFEERSGIYIIDLAKTMQQIRSAVEIIKDTVTQHKSILFVGTKKQAKTVIRECAEKSGEYYVCERWLGGMLTNLTTIRKSIKTLEKIEKRIATGGEGLTKKELSELTKEQQKLDKNLSGIRAMRKTPGLLIIVDPSQEHLAVAEAKKLNIPVMALVDTNCNPDPIDHVIACNDDALKSVKLILVALTDAIIEKKKELKISLTKQDKKSPFKSDIKDKEEEEPIETSEQETEEEV